MVVEVVVALLLEEGLEALEVPVAVALVRLIPLRQLPALQTPVEVVAEVGRQPSEGELADPALSSSSTIDPDGGGGGKETPHGDP